GLAQLLRHLQTLDRLRQRLQRRLQPAHLLAAMPAAFEVALEPCRLLGVQRAQHVGGEILAPATVFGTAHANPSASSPRIFSNPSRIRPFTVPIGRLRIWAISEWLKPPK